MTMLMAAAVSGGGNRPTSSGKFKAAKRRPYVHWSADEWRYFALALHESNPQAGLLYSPTLSRVTQAMMDSAIQLMPPERQRRVKNVQKVRTMLLQIYSQAINSADRMFFPNGVVSPSADAPANAEPARSRKGHHSGPLRRVVWTGEEWVQVAAELHRMNPLKNFTAEHHSLVGITAADLKFAQRVLPEARHRNFHLAGSHPNNYEKLRPAFDTLREVNRLRAQDEARAFLNSTEPSTATPAAPEAQPAAPAFTGTATVAAAASAASTADAQVLPAVNPWEAAFKPLFKLLANVVLDQAVERIKDGSLGLDIVPMLRTALSTSVDTLIPAPAPAPTTTPTPAPATVAPRPAPVMHAAPAARAAVAVAPPLSAPVSYGPAPKPKPEAMAAASAALAALDHVTPLPQPQQQPHLMLVTPPAEKEPQYVMKVGIWGGHGMNWMDDVRRSFPTLDIFYADNKKHIGKLQRCDKVILMTGIVPSPVRQIAKKHLADKLVYINGSQTEVRGLLTAYAATPKQHKR